VKTKSGREINNSFDHFIAECIVRDIEPNTTKPSEKLSAFLVGIPILLTLGLAAVFCEVMIISVLGINKKFEGLCFMFFLLFIGGVFNDLTADYYNNAKEWTKCVVINVIKNLFLGVCVLIILYLVQLKFNYEIMINLEFQYWIIFGVIISIWWLIKKHIIKGKKPNRNL
jgi:O-antigen/teichoic acid export membrane protein